VTLLSKYKPSLYIQNGDRNSFVLFTLLLPFLFLDLHEGNFVKQLEVVSIAYCIDVYLYMHIYMEKNKSNENFKTTIPSNNYDTPKTTGECEMF